MKFNLYVNGVNDSIFRNYIDLERLHTILTHDALKSLTDDIKQCDNDDDKQKLKLKLPLITPMATIEPTLAFNPISGMTYYTKRLKDVKEINPVMPIDLDKLTLAEKEFAKMKLENHPSTIFVFTSPRQKGLKALILLDKKPHMSENKNVYNAFKYNKDRLVHLLGLSGLESKFDNAQFNTNQPMMLSYDKELYFNFDAKPLNFTFEKPEIAPNPKPIKRHNLNHTRIDKFIWSKAELVQKDLMQCAEGTRHVNIIRVQSVKQLIHYAPHLENELKTFLLGSCKAMYKDGEISTSNVEQSFNKAWNTAIDQPHKTIENIIQEIKLVS